ncbi:fungal specific transcription factor domain-containing protein [Rutstroemia sp. NJR-2017a BBW]|nr:fungal specific transcription factor domain-containing protein [Rutstroemia sp. NJR-2017a BBW]
MSLPNSTPSIALFGATGGTGLSVLSQILTHDPSTHISILCRTPSKLSTQYPTSIYPNLRLIKGDIYDTAAVKNTLLNAHTGRAVDIAISSLGMGMVRDGWWWRFSDPEICFKGTQAILAGLSGLESAEKVEKQKTKLIVLSTTGISTKSRDIPLLMTPLYYGLLRTPHEDKKKMEELILKEEGRKWVIVRPSWLLDGVREGRRVRVGWEDAETGEVRREIGVAVAREEVGRWVFEEGVRDGGRTEWEGRLVSLSY